MTNRSYKKKLKEAFDKLNIISLKTDHFGRYVTAAVLDMEEIDPMITQAIGNWDTDRFWEVHSTKLPLLVMCDLAGGDLRRGHYQNPRSTFKDNAKHKELAE